MNFSEALLLMKEGKKVRLKNWALDVYISCSENVIGEFEITDIHGDEFRITNDLLFGDWAEYRETDLIKFYVKELEKTINYLRISEEEEKIKRTTCYRDVLFYCERIKSIIKSLEEKS